VSLEAGNILTIDKRAYHHSNTTETSKLIFQVSSLSSEDQVLAVEKLERIITVNTKLRMLKWPARQFMVANLINDRKLLINNN
jgi:hypothetical protein